MAQEWTQTPLSSQDLATLFKRLGKFNGCSQAVLCHLAALPKNSGLFNLLAQTWCHYCWNSGCHEYLQCYSTRVNGSSALTDKK